MGDDESVRWGRAASAWLLVAAMVAVVVVTLRLGPVAGATTLAVVALAAGAARAALPAPAALVSRSRVLDASLMVAFGVVVGVLAQIVPDA